MAHALLSPSSASRWLMCTPSARLEEKFPDTAGQAAAEGTLAHALCEIFLKRKLNRISESVFQVLMEEVYKNPLYDHAMEDHADAYAIFVMERFAEAQTRSKDALIFIEEKLDMSKYVEEGFGTGDTGIIADHILDAIDMKYGKGVLVNAQDNRQMMLYALGWLEAYGFVYNIDTVRVTIFQPRIDNYSTWEISVEELEKWAETELKEKAALAFAGEGDYVPGEHCRFCKAKAQCKALANYNLELASKAFEDPALLSEAETVEILGRVDSLVKWANSVKTYALDQAVNGKKWPGYKIVEGRSNRKYSDEKKVADTLLSKDYKSWEVYKEPQVKGITEMTKQLGKKIFDTLIGPLLVKPSGKPALVPESDKRPEFNNLEAAKAAFADVELEEETA